MPVKNQHPDYTRFLNKWERCEHVAAGQDAVHDAGEAYLPRLSDQENAEYEAYKKRTPFYNATWRTIVGLQGMLFRKPPKIEVPESMKDMLKDITLDGTPLHLLALKATEDDLKLGRVGLFVDYPIVPDSATKADAIAENHRPLMKLYKAQSIINWKTRNIKNETKLSMVVLQECVMVPEDEFTDKEDVQYRVLDLVDLTDSATGVVKTVYRARVIIIERDAAGRETEVTKTTSFPRIDGKFLDYIPFYFMGVDNVSWNVDEPPLIDLVDMNLSHYRTTADYEHGCHFTGLPTPVISGYTPEKDEQGKSKEFYIGSMTAWVFPRHEAKASFLEFTGQGLSALRENLEKKEAHMAILGARMLEPQKSGHVEAADTAAIHRGGEQSMLSSVAQAISIGITKALQTFARFAGADPDKVKFELNRDFFPVPMDSLQITALIAGWQNQAYSYETLHEKLKEGEIVPPESTAEDERKKIQANPPPVKEVGTTPGDRAHNSSPSLDQGGKGANPSATQMQNGSK